MHADFGTYGSQGYWKSGTWIFKAPQTYVCLCKFSFGIRRRQNCFGFVFDPLDFTAGLAWKQHLLVVISFRLDFHSFVVYILGVSFIQLWFCGCGKVIRNIWDIYIICIPAHFVHILSRIHKEMFSGREVWKIARLRVCRGRERRGWGGRKRALLLWGTALWSPFKLWPSMLSNIVSQTCSPPGFKLCSKGSPLWGSSV